MRLWVDTDVGTNPDDAVALLCARCHPRVELVGVSTVGAAPGPEVRADLAREVLGWPLAAAARPEPAGSGPAAAAPGPAAVPGPDPGPRPVPVVPGPELAAGTIDAARPDVVLGIGPATNLARLLAGGWAPPRLVLMGGALRPVRHRGAVRAAESNVAADPAAAAAVLATGHPVLVPLDVTARMRLDAARRDRLAAAVPDLAAAFAAWAAGLRAAGVPGAEVAVCLHDPLALLVATGDVPARVAAERLVVRGDGRLERARDPAVAPVEVVVDVDVPAALELVVELLSGRPHGPRGPGPPAGR